MSTETLEFGGNVPVSYATPGWLRHWQPLEALVGQSALQVHLDAGSLTVWFACWISASILMSPGYVAAIPIIAPRGLMVAVLLLELPGKKLWVPGCQVMSWMGSISCPQCGACPEPPPWCWAILGTSGCRWCEELVMLSGAGADRRHPDER